MWTFRAMNTEIAVAAPELSAPAERDLALAVEQLFLDTERRFSRFRPDSELARLNSADGPIVVSDELLELLVRARAHAVETRGVFEPAIGTALAASGYDRSFAPGVLDRDDEPSVPPHASIDMLDIDVDHRRVARPPHVQIDLGGFLKGRTVDRAAALSTGPVAVDAGGDAMLRGAPRGASGWTIEIEDPLAAANTIGAIVVRDRAVATSAANRRRWRRNERVMHHLIDPRTRAPAHSDVLQATVVAPAAETADVMAKVAFVVGADAAIPELERRGLGAVLVLHDGEVRVVGDLEVRDA